MILHIQTDAAMLATLTLLAAGAQGAAAQTVPLPKIPAPILAVPARPPVGTETPVIPLGNPGEWVTYGDYPTKALREGVSGTVGFRATIGVDGAVTGCSIVSSSKSQELDEATCRLVTQRARFSPARNPKGEAVLGQYTNRVRWVVPPSDSPDRFAQFVPLNRTVSFFVEKDGTVTQCKIITGGVDYSARAGSFCQTQLHYAPFRDASGNPVRRKVTITSIAMITDPEAQLPPRKKRR